MLALNNTMTCIFCFYFLFFEKRKPFCSSFHAHFRYHHNKINVVPVKHPVSLSTIFHIAFYMSSFFTDILLYFPLVVDMIILRNTRNAPMYSLKDMISCANKYPNKAAKTGSSEKINPVRAGEVYF